MASSLSSLTDDLAEGLHKGKCKDCKISLEYVAAKDCFLPFKCVDYYKNYEDDEDLYQRFQNTFQFCDGDINKFRLLLHKDTYPNKYMDGWERFNKTSLPTNLTMNSICDTDQKHAKRVWEDFGLQNLGHSYNLYVQSYTCCFQLFLKVSETTTQNL